MPRRHFGWLAGFALVVLASASGATYATGVATPTPTLGNEHWWSHDEPGWGLTVTYVGDVGFGVLFAYSPDLRKSSGKAAPQWFVLPEIRPLSATKDTYRSALYSTRGSSYASQYDPAVLQAHSVGEATLRLTHDGGLELQYVIGGHAARTTLRRMTFASDAFAGGVFHYAIDGRAAGCGFEDYFTWGRYDIAGPFRREGGVALYSQPSAFPMAGSPIFVADRVGDAGLIGRFVFVGGDAGPSSCLISGRFSATREAALHSRQTRDLTDHWWNARENGWGMSIRHQGDVIFAVLFIYSEQGRPEWYVMPDMRRRVDVVPATFEGTLYATAGSPLMGPYDPTEVEATAQGRGTLVFEDDGHAALRYTIGNIDVTKRIERMTVTNLPVVGSYRVRLAGSASCLPGPLIRTESWIVNLSFHVPTGEPAGLVFFRAEQGEGFGTPVPATLQQWGSIGTLSFRAPFRVHAQGLEEFTGQWSVTLDYADEAGIAGVLSVVGDGVVPVCHVQARFTGVRADSLQP